MRYNRKAKKWICDECQISIEGPEPPEEKQVKSKNTLGNIAIAMSLVGAVLIGGLYLTIPGLIIAAIAIRQGESNARKALFISFACLMWSLLYVLRIAPSLWGF
jgi:hypothetical protein